MENPNRLNFSTKLYKKITRLYPRAYRKRFGEELVQTFNDMHIEHPTKAWMRTSIDLLVSVPYQHVQALRNFMQTTYPTIKNPSVWIPIIMSLGALTAILIHLAIFGTAPEKDEGTTAHLFQILIAGQVPIVAFFVLKWLPRAPKQAFTALILQIVVALLPISIVLFLKW